MLARGQLWTYSPMFNWLEQDLASSPLPCTLAYWHNPLFSSGYHGNNPRMKPSWEALYAADAEVVLNGHDYERFAPRVRAARLMMREA